MATKKKVDAKEEVKEVTVDTDAIKEDLMGYIDGQLDQRFDKVFDEKIRKEFFGEIDKANKKIIREKNRKILFKNIFLILFFGIICLLVYLLYTDHYFDSFFGGEKKSNKTEVVEKTNNKKEETVEKVPTLEELVAEYGSYLDPYTISSSSSYVEDFYNGKLTGEIQNYMSLNNVDFKTLEVEEDFNTFDSNVVGDQCRKLFVNDCNEKSFDYNGNKVRYFPKLESYVTNSLLEKGDNSIKREIIDIQVENKVVTITTLEGVVVDDNLYSVSPNALIGEYQGESLTEYAEALNKVVYVFDNKKLTDIKKG